MAGRKPSTATRLGRIVRFSGRPVADVAGAVGVSPRTLSDWMGGRRVPTLPQQNALAQHFAVDRDYLFGDVT